MRIINTVTHGILDYLISILLIISPWIFEYYAMGVESIIPIAVGVFTISISLMTDYEMSVAKIIPMKAHLNFDILSGIILASSPWVFGFSEIVYLPHLIIGIFEIAAGLLSKHRPATSKRKTNLI